MDKKRRKRMQGLKDRLQNRQRRLGGARRQMDEPAELEAARREIEAVEKELEQLAGELRSQSSTPCRVCLYSRARHFAQAGGRDYWRCPACAATFLDASQLPDRDAERAEYLLHENDHRDTRYIEFLNRLARPLLHKLSAGQSGLDYGCGPGPTLDRLLAEAGHKVRLYDPLFQRDDAALEQLYDFITCSEVVEHFHRPADEFARLDAMLRPGGWLGVMTCFQDDDAAFADWHYRRDPTHVVFYRLRTFRRIARRFGWLCETPARNIVLMHKSAPSSRWR